MKYIIVDKTNGDEFTKEFDNKEKAIKEAKIEWSYLSAHDREKTEAFYVLESVNPNEDAENHFDGNIVVNFMPTKQEFIEKFRYKVENDSDNVWITDSETDRQANIDIYLVMHGEEEKEPFEASAILETNPTHEAWDDLYQSFIFD